MLLMQVKSVHLSAAQSSALAQHPPARQPALPATERPQQHQLDQPLQQQQGSGVWRNVVRSGDKRQRPESGGMAGGTSGRPGGGGRGAAGELLSALAAAALPVAREAAATAAAAAAAGGGDYQTPVAARMLPAPGRPARKRGSSGAAAALAVGSSAGGSSVQAPPSSGGVPTLPSSSSGGDLGSDAEQRPEGSEVTRTKRRWLQQQQKQKLQGQRRLLPTEPAVGSGRLPLSAVGQSPTAGRSSRASGGAAASAAAAAPPFNPLQQLLGDAPLPPQQRQQHQRRWKQEAGNPLARSTQRFGVQAAAVQQQPEGCGLPLFPSRPSRFAPVAAGVATAAAGAAASAAAAAAGLHVPASLTTQISGPLASQSPPWPAAAAWREEEQQQQPLEQPSQLPEQQQQPQQLGSVPLLALHDSLLPSPVLDAIESAEVDVVQPAALGTAAAAGTEAAAAAVGSAALLGSTAQLLGRGWTLPPTPSCIYALSLDSLPAEAVFAGGAPAAAGVPGSPAGQPAAVVAGEIAEADAAGGASPSTAAAAIVGSAAAGTDLEKAAPAVLSGGDGQGRLLPFRLPIPSHAAETPAALLGCSSSLPGQDAALAMQLGGGGLAAGSEARRLFVAETPACAGSARPLSSAAASASERQAPETGQLRGAGVAAAAAAAAAGWSAAAHAAITPAPSAAVRAKQAQALVRGLQLQLPLPVLQAVGCADGRHLALLLGSYAPAGEPTEVLVLRLPPGPSAASSSAAAAGDGGGGGGGGGVQVVLSAEVHRSQWGEGLDLSATNCLQLASTER